MIRGRLRRRHISVEEEKGELPLISASPVQINQVFLNLLVNAMQAIEVTYQEYGRIIIRTQCNAKDVIIEIVDNGCGIPAEVLPQIFDPFFTTKMVGDGTGLGLSITHGIVQDHGGRMEVESTPGAGAASVSSCLSRAGETARLPLPQTHAALVTPSSCQRRTEVRSECLATLAKRSRSVKPGVGVEPGGCILEFRASIV